MHQHSIIHGSMVYTGTLIAQVVGLPSPPGLVPVIPKYLACNKPSPWTRPSGNYCRVIEFYGPQGVDRALAHSGVRARYDPIYRAKMPYIEKDSIIRVITPREALLELISSPPNEPNELLEALYRLAREVGIEGLGITGSLAAGIQHSKSDIDLVALDHEAALRLYALFSSRRSGPVKTVFGGVRVSPPLDLSWRRTSIARVQVTWIGAGPRCPVLDSYYSIDQPQAPWRGIVQVEPGQLTALSYPPCVRTSTGIWLVSYEFNLAVVFFRGGDIYVEGLAGDRTIYLGTRELPGVVRLLNDPRSPENG